MHVVHLYDGPLPVEEGRDSVSDVVWNVARETAAADHRVTVIERQWPGLPPEGSREGVRFERLALSTGADEPETGDSDATVRSPVRLARQAGDHVNFARLARRRLSGLDLDVLHVHRPHAACVLLAVDRQFRPRTVFTAHHGEHRSGLPEAEAGSSISRVRSAVSPDVYLAKRAARTTVPNADAEEALRARGVPAERLEVVPNGIELDRFLDVDAAAVDRVRESYWGGADTALLFVAPLRPQTGLDDLVRAMSMLREQYDRTAHLVAVGEDVLEGAYTSEVRALVRERGLTDHVSLVESIPDEELPALYAAADVFVSAAREEGFGMNVAEALAAGTPVVATRVGGVPELLDSGTCGRLLVPGHPTGLAATLDDLLADTSQRERLAEAAREHVQSFAWPAVGERFLEVYASLAS